MRVYKFFAWLTFIIFTFVISGCSGSTDSDINKSGINSSAVIKPPTICSGSSIQSCSVTNGSGYQTSQCIDDKWQADGACNVVCDSGYMLSGGTCVVDSLPNYNNVYYISADNSASDSNAGTTTGAPWASFDHA